MTVTAVVVGAAIAVLAFLVRVAVHRGRTPGGVDTWYYLAYADAVRRRPSLFVRLPQYLLQDERQSYPPVFPTLLALLPQAFLRRWYWTVSPAIDCVHLLLLYVVTLRLTASVTVGAFAAAAYAFTPHLVSETRSLSARPFGALLHSVAVLLLLKAVLHGTDLAWWMAAVLAGAVLFLSSAAMAAAYAFVCPALALAFGDPRLLAVPAGAFVLAVLLSGGHMLRVVGNYLHAVRYWARHRRAFGSHPVRDSPVLGEGKAVPPRPGDRVFLGQNAAQQLLRLLGENPFLLALLFAPRGVIPVAAHLYWWAVALCALAVIATVVPVLRAFGPGRSYMKAAVFPTAYTIAAGIGTPRGLLRPLGLVTLACLAAGLAAIAFFYVYVRGRPSEQTASIPPGLDAAARHLREMPDRRGVLVLPCMYADYACYWSERPVVWGGHCGDLTRFSWVAPRITRPLAEMCAELGVGHVLIDRRFVSFEELRLSGRRAWEQDGFEIHALDGPAQL
jgi:hypothetical protein